MLLADLEKGLGRKTQTDVHKCFKGEILGTRLLALPTFKVYTSVHV